MRTRTLIGTLVCGGLLAACGSSDSNKKVRDDDAGASGGSGTGGGSSAGGRGAGGGSAAGGASGGADAGPGAGGSGAGGAPDGGDGGPIPVPPGTTFFSVDRATRGQTGTGVAVLAANPQTAIFASPGRGPTEGTGTNVAVVTASQLGLLDTDDLDAIAVLRPVPASPLYTFSVRDGATVEGHARSEVNRAATAGDVAGDLFTSDGIGASYDGESGARPGANALIVDESRLGLIPSERPDGGVGDGGLGATPFEDLDALEVGLDAAPARIYFSVRKGAAGPAGSALASVAAAERGCTVFQADGSGTHTVAYTCADLGLAAGDELDALAMQGGAAPARILFSVQAGATGLAGTAVEAQALAGEAGGDIFSTDGEGTNEVLVEEAGLGLESSDDLDALAFEDVPRPALYRTEGAPCAALTPPPEQGVDGGPPHQVRSRAFIADDMVAYLRFESSTGLYNVIAYDSRTCAPVGAATLLGRTFGAEQGFASKAFTVVPRAGWTRTDPLSNVDLYNVAWGAFPTQFLARYADARGEPAAYSVISPHVEEPEALVYRSMPGDFVVFSNANAGRQMVTVAAPAGTGTTVAPSAPTFQPHPCSEYEPVAGYNATTNTLELISLYELARHVCLLDGDLYSREPARNWATAALTDGGTPRPQNALAAVFSPGNALYFFDYVNSVEGIVKVPAVP